jgi:DNA polymerase III delta subunit
LAKQQALIVAMDPITGIGLAASVFQLCDAALKSARAMSKIRKAFKNGSEDVQVLKKTITSHKITLQSKVEATLSV